MAETGARRDPFLAFRFEIKLGDLAVGGFSECTGLQIETEFQDYAEGGLNTFVRKFPTRTKQTNVTLKHGIVDRVVWDWYDSLVQGQVKRLTGTIIVKNPVGDLPVMTWLLHEVLPCKWQGPDLNATQNSVAVETLELCHQGLERTL